MKESHPALSLALGYAVSLCLALLFCTTTSPLFDSVVRYDMATYHIIGSGWIEHGHIPYMDYFDNKGPLLYLIYGIASVVSHLFPDGTAWSVRGGLLLAESVNVFVCLWIVGRISSCMGLRRITMQALFFCCYRILGQGLLTESLSMPFILLSMYLFAGQRHTQRARFAVYGLCCAATMLLRLNNALPIALFAAIECIRCGAWRHVPLCIASCLAVITPFAAYFAAQGAWSDMVFCLFKANWLLLTGDKPFYIHYLLPFMPLLLFGIRHIRQQWIVALPVAMLCCVIAVYPLMRTTDTAEADMLVQMSNAIAPDERNDLYILNTPYMTILPVYMNSLPINRYFGSYANDATTKAAMMCDLDTLHPRWIVTCDNLSLPGYELRVSCNNANLYRATGTTRQTTTP